MTCQKLSSHTTYFLFFRAGLVSLRFRKPFTEQMCGFGDILDGFNFSTERKRILNHKFEPSFEDNVKQVLTASCVFCFSQGKGRERGVRGWLTKFFSCKLWECKPSLVCAVVVAGVEFLVQEPAQQKTMQGSRALVGVVLDYVVDLPICVGG